VWAETWDGGAFVARTPYRRVLGLALLMAGIAVLVPYAAFVPFSDALVVTLATPFALVALALAYFGIAFLLGAATLRLDRAALDYAWRPLPVSGGARVDAHSIAGFEARARKERGAITWVAARIAGTTAPRYVMQLFDEEHAAFVVARLNAAHAQIKRSGA